MSPAPYGVNHTECQAGDGVCFGRGTVMTRICMTGAQRASVVTWTSAGSFAADEGLTSSTDRWRLVQCLSCS